MSSLLVKEQNRLLRVLHKATLGAARILLPNDWEELVDVYKASRVEEISVRQNVARGVVATPKGSEKGANCVHAYFRQRLQTCPGNSCVVMVVTWWKWTTMSEVTHSLTDATVPGTRRCIVRRIIFRL